MVVVSDWKFSDSGELQGHKVDWQISNDELTVEIAGNKTTLPELPLRSVQTLQEVKAKVRAAALDVAADMLKHPERFRPAE